MSFKTTLMALAAATFFTLPATAEMAEIMVDDPYARAATPMAKSGAAFMAIMNQSDEDDRLVSASSDVATRVELHTHIEEGGVMKMTHVEEGFEIPAGGMLMMERGGKHVMFMGLKEPFEQGKMIDVTLTFENAGDVRVQIPVDLERKPGAGAHGGHSMSN